MIFEVRKIVKDQLQSFQMVTQYQRRVLFQQCPTLFLNLLHLLCLTEENFYLIIKKDFLQRLWMDLCEKITNTSIDCISSLKDDVFLVLGTMKSLNGFDFSGLEELLGSLFDKAAAFGEAWSRSSEEAAKEALAQQLSEAKDRLDKAKTKEIKEASQAKSTQEGLEHIVKELGDLKKRKKLLSSSLKRQQRLFSSAQEDVHMIEAEIIGIGDISPLDDEAIENLNASKTRLEAAKEDLKKFNLFV
ncbi:uncharacterized protein LOC142525138 [Primulina tabacum]|uniref:uncharacterized protein LOC142525138 n=1 Tax=Primulina tabacum TaxID=48773 RepID=UPI003F5AB585